MRFDLCDFLETCASIAAFAGFVFLAAYSLVGDL